MTGNLERIKKYPEQGYQIEQDIPEQVWEAFKYLKSQGYTHDLLA